MEPSISLPTTGTVLCDGILSQVTLVAYLLDGNLQCYKKNFIFTTENLYFVVKKIGLEKQDMYKR